MGRRRDGGGPERAGGPQLSPTALVLELLAKLPTELRMTALGLPV